MTVDRRTATRERTRFAIIEAARVLIEERDGSIFTVKELADHADVSRRTIFNHFETLDDVRLAVCDAALAGLVDDFLTHVGTGRNAVQNRVGMEQSDPIAHGISKYATAHGSDCRTAMFDEIARSMHSANLPNAIAKIVRAIGVAPGTEHEAALAYAAFSRAGRQIVEDLARRYPQAEVIDVELLVQSLMGGVMVIANHWTEETGATVTAESQSRWSELLDRLLENSRNGYLPTP